MLVTLVLGRWRQKFRVILGIASLRLSWAREDLMERQTERKEGNRKELERERGKGRGKGEERKGEDKGRGKVYSSPAWIRVSSRPA